MSDASTPRRVLGRYALFGEIASGGMATVHFGRLYSRSGFSRTVAIKRLHPHLSEDPAIASMFVDEARATARIRHPHVVPTIDVIRAGRELFLVMDYVDGEPVNRLLAATLQKEARVPLDVACAIIVGVLHGLQAAHETVDEQGCALHLIHRDVSPQNILVGADGNARIIDFGIAKARGRIHETREGELKGKFAYMAPEQFDGQASRRSDVYSAGVVLWEILAHERLFHEEASVAVARVRSGDIPRPSTVTGGIPPALEAIVMKAVSRGPEERFASAKEMASAIERAVALAPASKVAQWVEATVGGVLAKRAIELAAVEAVCWATLLDELTPASVELAIGGPELEIAPPVSTPITTPRPGRRRWALALAAVVVLAGAGAGAFARLRSRSPSPVAALDPGAAASTAPSPSNPTVPAASASALGATLSSPIADAGSRIPSPQSRPHGRGARAAAAGRPTTPSCEVPFTTDAQGIKHFRPECL